MNTARLPKPAPLPEVQAERAEAVAFFSGMWHGIALGAVMAACIAYLLAMDVSAPEPTACLTLFTLQHP